MSEEDFPWYQASLEEFNKRTHCSPKFAKCIEDHSEQIGLKRFQTCISIGVGQGDADIPLLSGAHLNNLQTYTAVEPNAGSLGVFKERFDKLGRKDLEVTIVNTRVEDWEGPADRVDVVFLIEVLYHIHDKPALFKRAVSWLKPGGVLLMVHGGEDIFYRIALKFDVADELYTAKDIRVDFDKLGMSYDDVRLVNDFDIRDRNRHIMNFLLQKQASEDEFDKLDKFLLEMESSGLCGLSGVVFWHKVSESQPATTPLTITG